MGNMSKAKKVRMQRYHVRQQTCSKKRSRFQHRVTNYAGVCLLLSSLGFTSRAEERDASLYVTFKKCYMCHKKDKTGNQYKVWQGTPHAAAFKTLGSVASKEVAASLGIEDPQTSGKCLRCHSTAYNFTEEVQTDQLSVEDGVTCQSCHGPAKLYKSKEVHAVDLDKAIELGMIYPNKKECTICHNTDSPTWDPERYTTSDGRKVGFDTNAAYEKIKHEIPEQTTAKPKDSK